MAQLNLNDIQPGMVLAAPVFNKNGSLLLQKGIVLTEKHVKIFKTWGIAEADIEGYDINKVEEDAYAFLSDEEIKEIEAVLVKRFPEIAENDVMKEIFRITKKHKINEALSKGSDTI